MRATEEKPAGFSRRGGGFAASSGAFALASLLVLTGVVAVAPGAQAYHCTEQGYEVCRSVEVASDVKDWLVYCVKQKFIGDSWRCLPNPMP